MIKRIQIIRFSAVSGAVLLLFLGGADADVVEITVQADRVTRQYPVHPFGINLNYLRDVDSLWPARTRSIEAALKDMKVRWLRYPGGEKSDHVRFASPPYTNSAPVVLDYCEKSQRDDLLDFDEFIALCRRLGAEPWVVVPYDTSARTKRYGDFLEHAVAWVTYANRTRGYGVKYWEVGNENWSSQSRNPNPGRSVDILQIAKAMKKADPSIRIAASGVDPAVVKDAVDILSLSGYVGTWEKSDWKETFDSLQGDALLSPSWKKEKRVVKKSGRDYPLAVVEWSFKYDKQRNDLISAIGALDAAGRQYRYGEGMINHMYWTTRYMDLEQANAVFCTLDTRNELTATGRAAWIIGNFFTRQPLVCTSDFPQNVHAYAFLDDEQKRVNVLIINHTDLKQSIRVRFEGMSVPSLRSVFQFSGTGPLDTKPVWKKIDVLPEQLAPYSAIIIQSEKDHR